MIDDHTPFLQRGILAADLIDFDYPYWHTTQDTADKVAPASLERVGRVLKTFLETTERRNDFTLAVSCRMRLRVTGFPKYGGYISTHRTHNVEPPPETAILVGVEIKGKPAPWRLADSLTELERLATTAGLEVVGVLDQRLDRPIRLP